MGYILLVRVEKFEISRYFHNEMGYWVTVA